MSSPRAEHHMALGEAGAGADTTLDGGGSASADARRPARQEAPSCEAAGL